MFTDFISVTFWWLTILVLGLAFLPLTCRLFPKFWYKGYLFSKIISIAVLSFLAFIGSFFHLLPFYRESFFLLFLAAVLVNWFLLFRSPVQKKSFIHIIKNHLR